KRALLPLPPEFVPDVVPLVPRGGVEHLAQSLEIGFLENKRHATVNKNPDCQSVRKSTLGGTLRRPASLPGVINGDVQRLQTFFSFSKIERHSHALLQ